MDVRVPEDVRVSEDIRVSDFEQPLTTRPSISPAPTRLIAVHLTLIVFSCLRAARAAPVACCEICLHR
jgi:hypothetical protein